MLVLMIYRVHIIIYLIYLYLLWRIDEKSVCDVIGDLNDDINNGAGIATRNAVVILSCARQF